MTRIVYRPCIRVLLYYCIRNMKILHNYSDNYSVLLPIKAFIVYYSRSIFILRFIEGIPSLTVKSRILYKYVACTRCAFCKPHLYPSLHCCDVKD